MSREEATDVNPIRQTLEADLLQSGNRLAGLNGRAGALRIQILQARRELDGMAQLTGQHDDLVRAVKEAESNYQALSTQFEQAKLAEQMDRERMANVAVAEAPTRMDVAEPRLDMNVLAATGLGLALVLGMILAAGMRRRTVFTPWELEGLIGAPVLGAIPLTPRTALPPVARHALEA